MSTVNDSTRDIVAEAAELLGVVREVADSHKRGAGDDVLVPDMQSGADSNQRQLGAGGVSPVQARDVSGSPVPMYVPLDAGQMLAGKPDGTVIWGYTKKTDMVPPLRHPYIYPRWVKLDLRLQLMNYKDPIWIDGPTGCGKTLAVKQLAARINYPVYELTATPDMSASDLYGHVGLEDGETVWVDGALALAMRYGGIFLLNEIDLLSPSLAAGLNTILDGSPLLIPETGEAIKPHPGFKFIATANTTGHGDISGNYSGTQRQNIAFVNRFVHISGEYLPRDAEFGYLKKVYGAEIPEAVLSGMCRFADIVRHASGVCGDDAGDVRDADEIASVKDSGIQVPVSMRSLVRWCEQVLMYKQYRKNLNVLDYAMRRSLATDESSLRVLSELLQRLVGDGGI